MSCFHRGAIEPVRRLNCGPWQAELLPRQPYEARYTPDAFVIGFSFDSQDGVHAFASDRLQPFRTRPNSLAFVPPGCEVFSLSRTGGEYLRLTMPGSVFDVVRAPRRFSDAVDPPAIAAARAIRGLLLQALPPDPAVFERHVAVLADRAACFLDDAVRPSPAAGWLTPNRLKRIDDLIADNLDTSLSVSTLAHALALSEGFFARAFKAAMGIAPHDYLIDRRIARARARLCAGEVDLSAIALAAGFSSHAHMTAVFRHRLGTTPSALRAGLDAVPNGTSRRVNSSANS
ncbi:MAG: AraC family transcriptional regulator [Azospirillaceae bacterium]|nr:AraC family transcriptional regulator [Azospirillaceae bacterium]